MTWVTLVGVSGERKKVIIPLAQCRFIIIYFHSYRCTFLAIKKLSVTRHVCLQSHVLVGHNQINLTSNT